MEGAVPNTPARARISHLFKSSSSGLPWIMVFALISILLLQLLVLQTFQAGFEKVVGAVQMGNTLLQGNLSFWEQLESLETGSCYIIIKSGEGDSFKVLVEVRDGTCGGFAPYDPPPVGVTIQPAVLATAEPSPLPTETATNTPIPPSATLTYTPTAEPSPTPTSTVTPSPTITATVPNRTSTATVTPTASPEPATSTVEATSTRMPYQEELINKEFCRYLPQASTAQPRAPEFSIGTFTEWHISRCWAYSIGGRYNRHIVFSYFSPVAGGWITPEHYYDLREPEVTLVGMMYYGGGSVPYRPLLTYVFLSANKTKVYVVSLNLQTKEMVNLSSLPALMLNTWEEKKAVTFGEEGLSLTRGDVECTLNIQSYTWGCN